MSAVYLYGFTDVGSGELLPQLATRSGLAMTDGQPIESLQSGRVLAVTCTVDEDEYRNELRQPPGWLADRACRHAALLSALLGDAAVLPVKFGALFSTTGQLTSILDAHEATIGAALDHLRGYAEWGVKMFVDEAVAQAVLADRDPKLCAGHVSMSLQPGARYLRARQFEAMAASALRSRTAERNRALAQRLAKVCTQRMDLALAAATASDDPTMVFHAAMLLPWQQDTQTLLFDVLDEPARQWADEGWRITLSGPWPAYHFGAALIGDLLA